MAGFQESGLPGRLSIREGFHAFRDDPDKFISNFQEDNSVLLPSLRPALRLLDLQGVRHITFHESILGELKEKFLKQIELCDQPKMPELVDHIFQFIHVDLLRPVIMAALRRVPEVKPAFLDQIADNKLYNSADCPIEVKRQVWIRRHALFGDAVGPLLTRYLEDKHDQLYSIEKVDTRNFFSLPPRQRRQKALVKELIDMIGNSIELYNLVLQFLRTLFLKTKQEHYCSLRSELLMAFHDADIKEVRQVDPCHKFTWCLDACIRDRSIDSKRLKELQSFLDGMKKGQEEILGDIAMIFFDPYATNTIVLSIMQQLNEQIKGETLPRTSSDLAFLIRTLSLSLGAWSMIKSQSFTEPLVDPDRLTRFLPLLMSSMLDDEVGVHTPKVTQPLDLAVADPLWDMVSRDDVAEMIMWHYIMQLIQRRKRYSLERVLKDFSRIMGSRPIHSTVLNMVVYLLARNADDFSQPSFCTLVFDDFLFGWVGVDEALRHILRLLWWVYAKMDSHQVVRLLTATQPLPEHAEITHDLHARLVDKIASEKANSLGASDHSNPMSPASSLSPPISPLVAVPFSAHA